MIHSDLASRSYSFAILIVLFFAPDAEELYVNTNNWEKIQKSALLGQELELAKQKMKLLQISELK
jgi:hypothetical protein